MNGGVIFLRVPKSTFEFAIGEVRKELRLGMSNISAVKIVANDSEMIEGQGVKLWRKEELVLSERDDLTLVLTIKEKERLGKTWFF